MSNFNDDIVAVLTAIFEKYEQQTAFHAVEPWSNDLWSQLQRAGFATIGADANLADHAAVAKATGKHAIALPLVETGLARWVADRAGLSVDEGTVVVCVGLEGHDRVQATKSESGELRVDGVVHRVAWGRQAAALLLPIVFDDETRWVLLEGRGLGVRESLNLANEPRDDLILKSAAGLAVGGVGASPREVRARGALMRCAAALGAMEFVLDSSLVYADQRHQFGRSLSSFQAIQHHLVLMAEAVASVSAAVDSAVHCAPEYRLMMVAAAKAMLGEQAAVVARLGHQIHGAIGTTEEHPIQSRTRRLWSWQDEFGTTADWAVDLADQLVFSESPGAWQVLTPPQAALAERDVAEVVPW